MPDFLEIAIHAAKNSGRLQMEHFGKSHNIEYKGEINLVTEVDRACEVLITKEIQAIFPEHDILAEEGGGERRDSEYKWIIDPLDGTTNYAHGYPLFCTSIALEHRGEILAAVVYDPNREECFTAKKGDGAFLNGRRIQVSNHSKLRESLLCTGFAYNVREVQRNNLNFFKNMLFNARSVRRDGAAALDLCYVACGRYDGFWEINLFPWDVAAGLLIVSEAKGLVTNFSGKPFSIYDKEILASNAKIHDEMVAQLQ